MKKRILYDEHLQEELRKAVEPFPQPVSKEIWKAALDSIVNLAFPGTGEDYEIVIPKNVRKQRQKVS